MNPHRQSFDRCHRQILHTYPHGEDRDAMMGVYNAIRARPLADCAMMHITDFAAGDQDALIRTIPLLGYMCSSPAAILAPGGYIIESGRPIRVAADAVSAALEGRPVLHPLTGAEMGDAASRIKLCYDLRPEALIDKLFSERDLQPGPGRPGVLMICPDDAAAHTLAAHVGWSLTTDEQLQEDPSLTCGAILRAMRNGVPVFATMAALPEALRLDPELITLHPEFAVDENLRNRADELIHRISAAPRPAATRSHADLLQMASSFRLDREHEIVARGEGRWAITRGGQATLNTDFEWECEPMPSNRDDNYLSRNRFTLEGALAHLDAWIAMSRSAYPQP